MDYLEINFNIVPNEEYVKDILSSELGAIDFESFVATDKGLKAYCATTLYDENRLKKLLTILE